MVAMKLTAILLLASFAVVVSDAKYLYKYRSGPRNDRPIIGILSQEVSKYVHGKYQEDNYASYIAASYVKFIEGAGARVVPIWIGQDEAYYSDIMSKINGVLWPGGASSLKKSNGYADAGYEIYRIAKRLNNAYNYFPIFGVCLGFELLTYLTADRQEHEQVFESCDVENIALPLQFKDDFRDSHMYRSMPDEIYEILLRNNVTANFHKFCVTEKSMNRVGIKNKLNVMTVNTMSGVTFVSSVESKKYPFYGIQFHPEKNLYEWVEGRGIPHDKKAVQISQYFANFFVNEARKNRNRFTSSNEEARSLIYNYPVTYTAQKNILFEQCYMFHANRTTATE